MKKTIVMLLAAAGLAIAADARATQVTFSADDGTRSASATFATDAGNLEVTLSNISLFDARVPTDILTAVIFNMEANLLPVSATVAPGSSVYQLDKGKVSTVAVTDVSGEWAYRGGLSGTPGGGTMGISSSGLGLFGPSDLFNPKGNLSGPVSPDGLQYGIAPAGDNPFTGNGDFVGTPLTRNTVKFLLTGVPQTIDLRYAISDVEFIFGTSLESYLPAETEPVPEPEALLLMLLGITAIFCSSERFQTVFAWRKR